MDKLERLKKLYYNPKEPGSFGGVKRLSEASVRQSGFAFAVDDVVRISKARKVFKKAICLVGPKKRLKFINDFQQIPLPMFYKISGKEIVGRFYAEELQKIDKTENDFWAIEKIIPSKGRGSSRQLLVKWVGFDDSFNSWIKTEWLKT
ncbi:chromo domain-containing protein [Caerostris extrusa]|uniref:Chromo domain-containing protein n=1 Tax=Caerostris extrusa TaxID=172846 RepID=A0AAV4NCN6_CAEEX|nr:chromo domain-containing protein [Caerostris extrusa]